MNKYFVCFILAIVYIGCWVYATLPTTTVKYTYIVGFDECANLTSNYGVVTITDCKSGLTYINPQAYRDIRDGGK